MQANMIGTMIEKVMINLDVLATVSMVLCILTILAVPTSFVLVNGVASIFPKWAGKMLGGRTFDNILTDNIIAIGLIIIGTLSVCVPIIIVCVYGYLTGMSIPEIWDHQMLTKWR